MCVCVCEFAIRYGIGAYVLESDISYDWVCLYLYLCVSVAVCVGVWIYVFVCVECVVMPYVMTYVRVLCEYVSVYVCEFAIS